MELPEHKAGLTLTHNDHKSVYETVEEFIAGEFYDDAFESAEARQRAIDTDQLWTLQWYPNTPVGFINVAAPTLEELLSWAGRVSK